MKLSIAFAFGIVTLAACTTQPVTRTADTRDLEARARVEAEAGNAGAAAELYRRLADAATGTARSRYLIEAARLAIEGGDTATAARWLNEARAGADAEQRVAIVVLLARVELDAGRPEAALQLLTQAREPPLAVLADAAEVRGRALLALGRYVEGVRELVEREIWLEDARSIIANQRLIWDSLPPQTPAARAGDSIVDGWLALAGVAAAEEDPAEFRRRLLDWRRVYVDHPAAGGLLAEILSAQRGAGVRPANIALLLPLRSAQRAQAAAVRDGFMAAHLESGFTRETTVSVYDTSVPGATTAYVQAQLDGADFIVGPLLSADVQAVMEQSGFVPTLALNWAQVEAPFLQSFYQFGLAPEDEVRAVAEEAVATGHRTAVAIVASNDRGYRLLNSFRAELETLGGRVLGAAGYVPDTQDVSTAIRDLLNISRSQQRHLRLQANLGVSVGFEPRRRQDVDMIFLQADATMGRLLAPNLRFYYAGDIPTYATSEIYEPANRSGDADLNGVIFPDVPLLLSPDLRSANLARELQRFWPQRASQYIRFYGLGFDAYRLLEALYDADAAQWPLAGFSGALSMDETGRVRRSMPFAQFRNGRPVALAPARAVEPQGLIGSR